MDPEPIFLTGEEILAIHRDQLERHGGQDGFIDQGVVESAVAQPKATMFGEFLHDDIAHMAAAYLFHLATTQGFMDGNKRTAMVCASVFLQKNGYRIDVPDLDMYPIALAVAVGTMTKDQLADWLRDHLAPLEEDA